MSPEERAILTGVPAAFGGPKHARKKCEKGCCDLEIPSTVDFTPWLLADPHVKDPAKQVATGKWLVFAKRENIDKWWDLIRVETQEGRLGIEAKVSTAMPSPYSNNPDEHVICVYTSNHDDEQDVMRVRESLRKLGVTWPISYKTDAATNANKYQTKGDRNISKYRV